MSRAPAASLSSRLEVATGLRFELFYGLSALLDPESRIHGAWRERTLAALPAAFHADAARLGGGPIIWAVIADGLRATEIDLSAEAIVRATRELDPARFRRDLLHGALHDEAAVADLERGTVSLQQALSRSQKEKREWLAFAGLYPYDPALPMIRGMEFLVKDPAAFRDLAARLLELFWKHAFERTWREVRPLLERSAAEKRRLLHAVSLAEFARAALLRIEVDEEEGVIRAARGGYEAPYAGIRRGLIFPSLFNDKRYWSAYEEKDGTHLYFPYFDPSISPDGGAVAEASALALPELDPAFILKALGDSTRFAMATLLAREPLPAKKLAARLGLSKPTVSHHVHQLRDAGLLAEKAEGGSVTLTLRRDVLEALSSALIGKLYDSTGKPRKPQTTRRKS